MNHFVSSGSPFSTLTLECANYSQQIFTCVAFYFLANLMRYFFCGWIHQHQTNSFAWQLIKAD